MSPLLQSGCLLLLLYHTAACYTPPLFAGRGSRGAGGGDAQGGGGGGAALACAALLGAALLAAACAVPTANLAQVVSELRLQRETQFLNEDIFLQSFVNGHRRCDVSSPSSFPEAASLYYLTYSAVLSYWIPLVVGSFTPSYCTKSSFPI